MKKRTILSAAAIVAVGCIAIPTGAYAANGGAWLLGRSNYESATTTVSNSAGTPLSLIAKSGYAPLKVNSTKTVTNLSADRLDGLSSGSFLRNTGKAVDSDKLDGFHAGSFAMRSGKTGTIAHDGTLDGLGAKCPAGTVFVSGGGFIPGDIDYIYYAGPDWVVATGALIPNSWIVVGDGGIGVSNVTCYQPSGAAIPGVATNLSQTTGSTPVAPLAAGGRAPALSDAAIAKIARIKDLRIAE